MALFLLQSEGVLNALLFSSHRLKADPTLQELHVIAALEPKFKLSSSMTIT